HWEIAGLQLTKAFPTYPMGFPPELIQEYEKKIGRGIIGNTVASGTVIINDLGDEHVKTGKPIIYTSADSVFQVAAHEEIIPLTELYRFCSIARDMLQGKHGVGRVIARPFLGQNGDYTRTKNRKDFSLVPFEDTILDFLKQGGKQVYGIGKIEDLYAGQGLTDAVHTKSNLEGIRKVIDVLKDVGEIKVDEGLIFVNLVDFDMYWGHRNDVKAYADGLMELDSLIPEVIQSMKDSDMLFFTADHGCDPTTPSTDHTREYVPVVAVGNSIRRGVELGIRESFSDLGKTIDQIFGLNKLKNGTGFLNEITLQLPDLESISKYSNNFIYVFDDIPDRISEILNFIKSLQNNDSKLKIFLDNAIYNTNLEVEIQGKFRNLEILGEDYQFISSDILVAPVLDISKISQIGNNLLNSGVSNFIDRALLQKVPVLIGYFKSYFDEPDIPFEFKKRFRTYISDLEHKGVFLFNYPTCSIEIERYFKTSKFKNMIVPKILTLDDVKKKDKNKSLILGTGMKLTPSARDYLKEKGYVL
ncbi:phosphopentomutase, partial [Candidatus Dependentiae bacterium]|nr:phosphopentomutase [Candidatus Dependentiae bacterium]